MVMFRRVAHSLTHSIIQSDADFIPVHQVRISTEFKFQIFQKKNEKNQILERKIDVAWPQIMIWIWFSNYFKWPFLSGDNGGTPWIFSQFFFCQILSQWIKGKIKKYQSFLYILVAEWNISIKSLKMLIVYPAKRVGGWGVIVRGEGLIMNWNACSVQTIEKVFI